MDGKVGRSTSLTGKADSDLSAGRAGHTKAEAGAGEKPGDARATAEIGGDVVMEGLPAPILIKIPLANESDLHAACDVLFVTGLLALGVGA